MCSPTILGRHVGLPLRFSCTVGIKKSWLDTPYSKNFTKTQSFWNRDINSELYYYKDISLGCKDDKQTGICKEVIKFKRQEDDKNHHWDKALWEIYSA